MFRNVVAISVALTSLAVVAGTLVWPASQASAATAPVTLGDYFFSPSNLTVNVGDTVTWTNPTGTLHTTTSNSGVWSSDMTPGATFSFTFTAPGVYNYHCAFHSSLGMVGTITVNDTSTPPTSTPTPTSPSSTSTPQPTNSPIPTSSSLPAVGGRGFTLGTGSVDLSWTGGTQQTGYAALRLSLTTGLTTLPGSPLPASAVSYSDTSPLPDPGYCYAVFPLGPAGTLGQSDLECLLTNTAGGANAASHFSVQLNQSSTATLRWTPPPGDSTGLALLALPLNGSPLRVTSLAGGQTSVTDNTFGVPTCYGVYTLNGSAIAGNTTTLCVIPGFASFSS